MENWTVKEYQSFIEEHLTDFLPEIDHKSITLYESMKYSLTAGGKRIRPSLLMATCVFAGGDILSSLPYACALEYIHTYSLIHDDLPLMDNDDFRRGKPTNHKVYGDAIAVLAGDGLLNTAFEAMNKDMLLYFDNPEHLKRRIRASYEITKGAGVKGMIAGQVADVESEGKSISSEMLDYIHINKTGALIRASILAGAYLGGAKAEMIDDLTKYAENLGLLFQITDDILDVTGDMETLGKSIGKDEKNQKSTYVTIYSLEEARQKASEFASAAKASLAKYYDNAEIFNDLIDQILVRTY